MLKLILNLKDEEKTFIAPKLDLQTMAEAAKFMDDLEKDEWTYTEKFEAALNLTVKIFKQKEVNYDNLLKGLEPDDFSNQVLNNIFKVFDGDTKRSGKSLRILAAEESKKEILAELEPNQK